MNRNHPRAWMVGIAAGISGLLLFLIIHAFWIVPIWFILPLGVPIAAVGGVAVESAYHEIAHRFPSHQWRWFATAGVVALMLIPSFVIAELRTPFYVVTPSGAFLALKSIPQIALQFLTDLIIPSMATGALLGGWLAGTRRAAIRSAIAGLMIALGPGHNIPFLGQTEAVGKEVAILLIVILVSAVVLVEGNRWVRVNPPIPNDTNVTESARL